MALHLPWALRASWGPWTRGWSNKWVICVSRESPGSTILGLGLVPDTKHLHSKRCNQSTSVLIFLDSQEQAVWSVPSIISVTVWSPVFYHRGTEENKGENIFVTIAFDN